jgi:H+/gluconate symporter-like permease
MNSTPQKSGFLHGGWFPFLFFLLYAAACVAALFILKPTGGDIGNATILKIFKTYAIAMGPVLAFLSLILMYVINGMRRIVRLRRVRFLDPVTVLLGVSPWLIFGWELAYREKRYTDIARAIIDFVGRPVYFASVAVCVIAALWLLLCLFSRRKAS